MFWLLDVVLARGSWGPRSEPWLLSTFEHHQTSNALAAAQHEQSPQEVGQPRGFPTPQLQRKGFPSPLARAKKAFVYVSAISNSCKLSCSAGHHLGPAQRELRASSAAHAGTAQLLHGSGPFPSPPGALAGCRAESGHCTSLPVLQREKRRCRSRWGSCRLSPAG